MKYVMKTSEIRITQYQVKWVKYVTVALSTSGLQLHFR